MHVRTLIALAMAVALVSFSSCSSGTPDQDLTSSMRYEAAGAAQEADTEFAGLPGIPQDEPGDGARAVSWTSSVDPTTPIFQHRTSICGVDPSCLILQGLYGMPLTHVPKPPYFAFAMYKVPLGASESDLLTLTTHGHVGAAGEQYWVGLANYSAGAWDWFGPATSAPDHVIDFTTLGYDFTSAAGNMYFVVVAAQANTFHLEDIWLDFDGDATGKPTWWNVWGRAYVNVSTGVPLGAANVRFENTDTGVIYDTIADGAGNWGMNLPGGSYKFRVWANTVLYDPLGATEVQTFDVDLELAAGQFTYHGTNAVYDGTVIPMPLITTDVY